MDINITLPILSLLGTLFSVFFVYNNLTNRIVQIEAKTDGTSTKEHAEKIAILSERSIMQEKYSNKLEDQISDLRKEMSSKFQEVLSELREIRKENK